MKRLKQLNECERSLFAQQQIDGINDEEFIPPADPMLRTTPATRSTLTITRIETPEITENVQSQLFESTIEQLPEQIIEQIPEQIPEQITEPIVEQPTDHRSEQELPSELIFRADTGAGTSRSFRTRAQTSSNEALRDAQPKRLKKFIKKSIIDVKAGTKYDPNKHLLLIDYTDIKDKYPNIKEDIYLPFNVKQPDPDTLAIENAEYYDKKHQQHPVPPTDSDKERAKRHGYVLSDDWKTQFTIKAFHGTRRVGSVIHQVAVEFSSGLIQWENVSNLKKNAKLSLSKYFKKLNLNK